MSLKKINYPFDRSEIINLRVGDQVLITGTIYTGRDTVHKYLYDGNESPVNFDTQMIYHCGPVMLQNPKDKSYQVIAAGPTTSIREEPYMADLIEKHGIVGVIGKGGMGDKTLQACKKFGAVYLHAIGGAAQVLANRVERVDGVHLLEFGIPEAIWKFEVVDFPVVVTMDSSGKSLHNDVANISSKILNEIIN